MSSKGLIFRLIHAVLHMLVLVLILIGSYILPVSTHNDTLLRVLAWATLECLYLLISMGIAAYSVCVIILGSERMPGFIARIYSSETLNNFPDLNFFYYAIMSAFVLYGAMLGCHIPALFFTLNGKPDSNSAWRIYLRAAVAVSVSNAILYFITGFIPLENEDDGHKDNRRSRRVTNAFGEEEWEEDEINMDDMKLHDQEDGIEVKADQAKPPVATEEVKEVRSNESQKAK